MSFLSRLFGQNKPASSPEGDPVEYHDFTIVPLPMPEGGQFRLAARIEKSDGGEKREHMLIRADLFPSRESAEQASIEKAQRLIDEQGDGLFG